jgi:hypothetical protein
MKRYLNIFLILAVVSFLCESDFILAQETKHLNKIITRTQKTPAAAVFSDIESAIAQGNVAQLSKYFSPHTYFSLSNGVSGYYSSNQAYYLIEDFFRIFRVTSFRFQNIQVDDENPYATGVYSFEFKGKKDASQVYISLKYSSKNWKITQITIN